MLCYIFQAELLCEDCGQAACRTIPKPQDEILATDSDAYPQGPYPVEEADSPSHCGTCGLFLENPLTEDGEDYVKETVNRGDGNPEVLTEWREHYSYLFPPQDDDDESERKGN